MVWLIYITGIDKAISYISSYIFIYSPENDKASIYFSLVALIGRINAFETFLPTERILHHMAKLQFVRCQLGRKNISAWRRIVIVYEIY